MADGKFRKDPRPESDVVALLEDALDSARRGATKSLVIIAANPVNHIETASAGDLSPDRTTVLLGGLVRAAIALTRR